MILSLMKHFSIALALFLVSASLMGVELGDTYEKVVDERGVPVNKMEVNGSATLNYVESMVKLRDGRVVAFRVAGVEAGYSYEKVIEKKGVPASKIEAGAALVLRYGDAIIKLREGKVVSVKVPGAGEVVAVKLEPKAASKPAPVQGIGEWTTDYAAALLRAKTEKKKVLLFFTGSDWCGWCKRLDREVLSTPEFKAYVRDQFVLVKLDFPRDIPQTSQEKVRNKKLSLQYGVQGYPTLVVLDSIGKSVGTLGYQPGGPGPFIEELRKY